MACIDIYGQLAGAISFPYTYTYVFAHTWHHATRAVCALDLRLVHVRVHMVAGRLARLALA